MVKETETFRSKRVEITVEGVKFSGSVSVASRLNNEGEWVRSWKATIHMVDGVGSALLFDHALYQLVSEPSSSRLLSEGSMMAYAEKELRDMACNLVRHVFESFVESQLKTQGAYRDD